MPQVPGKSALFILLTSLISFSCEKAFLDDRASDDPVANFDYLWKTLDEKYVYFHYKEIDWDEIYREFRPQIDHQTHEKELFRVMADMLFRFRDGHVNLYAPFETSRNFLWYMEHPANFNYNNIRRYYLGEEARHTGPLANAIIDSVGYVYYQSFGHDIREPDIDYLISDFAGLKGIVIDVRSNGGGSSRNSRILASRFADRKRLVAKHLYKRGPAHDDFFDPVDQYLEPAGPLQFTGPVVVLMNRYSFSASNDFILKMQSLPHVTLMGDHSGGGGGIPLDNELPNGWLFRFSGTKTLAPDGFNVEHGIAPDVRINLHGSAEALGRDNIIDSAIKLISEKAETAANSGESPLPGKTTQIQARDAFFQRP